MPTNVVTGSPCPSDTKTFTKMDAHGVDGHIDAFTSFYAAHIPPGTVSAWRRPGATSPGANARMDCHQAHAF
jgi:hypothetical protein